MFHHKVRRLRIKKDNGECQLSKLFGIAELSRVPCSEDLEMHHITYRRFGRENLNDVITVCTRCHDILTDAIRRERSSGDQSQYSVDIPGLCNGYIPDNKITKVEVKTHGVSKDLQVDREEPISAPQRKLSASVERVLQSHSQNIPKGEKG